MQELWGIICIFMVIKKVRKKSLLPLLWVISSNEKPSWRGAEMGNTLVCGREPRAAGQRSVCPYSPLTDTSRAEMSLLGPPPRVELWIDAACASWCSARKVQGAESSSSARNARDQAACSPSVSTVMCCDAICCDLVFFTLRHTN